MTPLERFDAKIRFIEEAETGMRRKLTTAERFLLARLFEKIIDGMDLEGGRLLSSDANYILTDRVGQIYQAFVKSHVLPITANLAASFLNIPSLNREYFTLHAPTKRMQEMVERITRASDKYIRARIGLDRDGNLKPGGYLQELTNDPVVQMELRRIMTSAVDNNLPLNDRKDLKGLKSLLRDYLLGTPGLARIKGQPIPPKPGALEARFDKFAFDLLQEADRAVSMRMATELDLMFATLRGGIIETTRQWCCERNGLTFTRDEMEAFNEEEWSGKKGDCEIHAGGHRCRHGWMFIATTRGLKLRPDVTEVGKGADRKLRYSLGVSNPPLNEGCEERK